MSPNPRCDDPKHWTSGADIQNEVIRDATDRIIELETALRRINDICEGETGLYLNMIHEITKQALS